ncbi:MAG: transglutaminase-like domain-containing protein [Desulfobacterales bacterium]|jgi:hypothetical protein
MSLYRNKPFVISGTVVALVFAFLFLIRLDLIDKLLYRPQTLSISEIESPHTKETWMNILQNKNKIGFSHSTFSPEDNGYKLQETTFMRINTMGMVQNINLRTQGQLNADFSLAEFDFEINSGRFSFTVNGNVSDDVLTVRTTSAGASRQFDIRIKKRPYLMAGITAAIASTKLDTGDRYTFRIFDPATMGQAPVIVEVIGKEDIQIMGANQIATKVILNFKGANQIAWIGENGDVLREKGILGIHLEKTTRNDALEGLDLRPSEDLTRTASVASNVMLANPEQLSTLKVQISGVANERVQLEGGRQTFENNVLTIQKESLANLLDAIDPSNLETLEKIFLRPEPFIQSDDQKIIALAREIVGNQTKPLEKTRKLVDWVHQHIQKRPVLSLPDALSTLEHRVGDCNEHAVLLAALARAAGIPCRVEAGLVYLKERFYYHAWNLVYLGRWVTVDSLLGQLPADVSHIRLVTGSPRQQLDIIGVIGNINLKILN